MSDNIDGGNVGGSGSGEGDKTLITARGLGDGLVIRISSGANSDDMSESLREFLISRKKFLQGNEIFLEWVGGKVSSEKEEIALDVLHEFGIKVKPHKTPGKGDSEQTSNVINDSFESGYKEQGFLGQDSLGREDNTSNFDVLALTVPSPKASKERENPKIAKTISIFDGAMKFAGSSQGGAAQNLQGKSESENNLKARKEKVASILRAKTAFKEPFTEETDRYGKDLYAKEFSASIPATSEIWDDADTRMVITTLRSGQRFETEHSAVIIGDVNSGAEVVAGGDIIVLGSMRGVAHAGAFDETGGGRMIFALDLQPTQLRIGTVITRGNGENNHKPGKRTEEISIPEVAYVDGATIVVEPYNSKTMAQKSVVYRSVGNLSK